MVQDVVDGHRAEQPLGMSAVVEARTRREALTAVDAGARIIAIDTRDPDTLVVDCGLFDQVTDVLPTQVTRIAAGGVRYSSTASVLASKRVQW